ncbi:MAG TPA: phosphotransferase [Smithellaceae bacterium]|nr:phosphotransferase [Smithellaceae bacterium]
MTIITSEIRTFLNQHLGHVDYRLVPIEKGGSDRHFFRVILMDARSFIFMRYGTEVEENAYWTAINRFLNDLHLPVPLIIAFDAGKRFVLTEDLGDDDLFSQKGLPWSKRRHYYLAALSEIHRLHRHPPDQIPPGLKLCRGYDRDLYVWEHNYFLDHFVGAVCNLSLPDPALRAWQAEADTLIARLLRTAPCLIHRDFQSQNILIRDERPVFIDFQGLRQGSLYYDLGSLICDPYVVLTGDERRELKAFYYRIFEPDYSLAEFTTRFWEGAAQRLMQALGAYGFLGLTKNKPGFLQHIENGLVNLIAAAEKAALPVLSDIANQCCEILKRRR